MHDLSYQERLIVLNLEALEHRRLSSDLTLYYEVFHNLTPWAPSDYFNVFITPHDLHSLSIFVNRCVVLINLLMTFLPVASLNGTVCLVLSLIQSLFPRSSVLLEILICQIFL